MITFDHVTYTYEGQTEPSLWDCSFAVEPGELILFTGESRCGKTTIIKLINGLLQHSGGGTLEGAVTVGGRDVAGTPLWELAQTVGSVFQNPKSQFFNLDTTGEVLFGLESRGASLLCPAGRSSASPVPARGPWDRRCLCWMSPPPIWTEKASVNCGTF